MKTYFLNLLNYDRDINLKMMEMIRAAGSPEKPVQLMAHLLGAQRVWLNRCRKEPAIGGAIWPDWNIDELEDVMQQNYEGWLTFIEGLNESGLTENISYRDSKGNPYENLLIDIIGHVFNHGTHHRAQIGQLLKFDGVDTLPVTDYVIYIRERSK